MEIHVNICTTQSNKSILKKKRIYQIHKYVLDKRDIERACANKISVTRLIVNEMEIYKVCGVS